MRVIAGSAGGRRLKTPPWEGLRPTGDKVKGAIFSLLDALAYKRGFEAEEDENGAVRFAAALAWQRVLDLYAGSGALGIEALSRGAERAEFVESDVRARALIRANLEATGLADRAVIHALSAEQAVSTLTGRYDLILADPPYAHPGAGSVLAGFADSARVADTTVIVWEHRSNWGPPDRLGPLRLRRTRRHGTTALSLFSGQTDAGAREGANADQSSP